MIVFRLVAYRFNLCGRASLNAGARFKFGELTN
jgi:hypothetical protein